METWLHDWLSLLLRWSHFITGVAWIGASFYFNWLENQLERRASDDPIAGDLWAVHGGGFYYLQKYRVAPQSLPPKLHWFKYEAYFTWLTGAALLAIVYYWNPSLYLMKPGGLLHGWQAVTIGVVSVVVSWLVYDGLCRSPLSRKPLPLALSIFAYFTVLAWGLSALLSGRAAYLHVGAAIGTVMVANVAHVIIPAQRELVAAVSEGREPDAGKGQNALLRSRHNNYLTLPVLFLMISTHYPATYGRPHSWLILLVFSVAAVGIRYWFNVRHLPRDDPRNRRWVLPASLLLMLGLIAATLPRQATRGAIAGGAPTTASIMPVITNRCTGCHASEPTLGGFPEAPLGVVLETPDQVTEQAARIHQVTVATQTMPLGNITGMTPEERALLDRWFAGRAD